MTIATLKHGLATGKNITITGLYAPTRLPVHFIYLCMLKYNYRVTQCTRDGNEITIVACARTPTDRPEYNCTLEPQ